MTDSVLKGKNIKDVFKISSIFMEKERVGNEVSWRKMMSLFEEVEVNSAEIARWIFEKGNKETGQIRNVHLLNTMIVMLLNVIRIGGKRSSAVIRLHPLEMCAHYIKIRISISIWLVWLMAADMKNPGRKRVCISLMPTAKPTREEKHYYFSNSTRPWPGWAPVTLPKFTKVQT